MSGSTRWTCPYPTSPAAPPTAAQASVARSNPGRLHSPPTKSAPSVLCPVRASSLATSTPATASKSSLVGGRSSYPVRSMPESIATTWITDEPLVRGYPDHQSGNRGAQPARPRGPLTGLARSPLAQFFWYDLDHPATLITPNNVARWLGEAGDSRDVGIEHQPPGGRVGPAPLGDVGEEARYGRDSSSPVCRRRQPIAFAVERLGERGEERFDIAVAVQIGQRPVSDKKVRTTIEAIPADAWVEIEYPHPICDDDQATLRLPRP